MDIMTRRFQFQWRSSDLFCFVSMLLRSHGLCTFSFPDSHSSPFSLWYFSLSTFELFPDFSCFSISSFLLFTIRFSVSLFRFLWKRRSPNAFFYSETLIFWSVWLSRKFLPLMEKVLFVCFNLSWRDRLAGLVFEDYCY